MILSFTAISFPGATYRVEFTRGTDQVTKQATWNVATIIDGKTTHESKATYQQGRQSYINAIDAIMCGPGN